MCRKSFIVIIILNINYLIAARIASSETKSLINCTLDDLRDINEQYQKSVSLSLSFVFTQCDLPMIPDAFLVNVSGLQSIDFQSSSITSLSGNALSGLTKLKVLRIVDSPNLTQIQQWTTENLNNLNILDLQNNHISTLDENALRHYPNLKCLNLQVNHIGEIPVGFLSISFQLETLNLAENALQRIESDTFKALLHLIDLDLAYNQIHFIDPYAFTTTTLLQTLRLNGNQIKTINSMVFFNLDRLKLLNLSENALSSYALDEDSFKQNTQLQHLDLSYNEMYSIIPNVLTGLRSLQVRTIFHCYFSSSFYMRFQN